MNRDRKLAYIRIGLFAAFVLALFIVATVSGQLPGAGKLRDWGESLGGWGPVLYIPLSAALSCLFVPGPALAGSAGLLFGTAVGTPLALASATLAACAQMLIARYLAGRQVSELLPKRVKRFDDFLERRGFLAVLYMRLMPGVPYVAVNYGAGLTRLRVKHMAGGTVVGAAPRTFAYVALGGSLSDLGKPEAVIAIVILVVMAIGGLVVARRGLGPNS